MPIVQSKENGLFELYFYVAYKEKHVVRVKREVIIRATRDGYDYDYATKWNRTYLNESLDIENGVISRVEPLKKEEEITSNIKVDSKIVNNTKIETRVSNPHEYEELLRRLIFLIKY